MSLPKIKYVSIFLETKKPLCEYKEEVNLNIQKVQKVIRNILDTRVKQFDNSSLIYEDFTFFYKNDSLITAVCATDINYPNSTAFEFLNVLVNTFRSKYKEEDIRQAHSFAYNDPFKKTTKEKVTYYNKNLDSTNCSV